MKITVGAILEIDFEKLLFKITAKVIFQSEFFTKLFEIDFPQSRFSEIATGITNVDGLLPHSVWQAERCFSTLAMSS